MDCNFCWQPVCFQMVSDFSTNTYLDQFSFKSQNHLSSESSYEDLKKKCDELELENSRLK